MTTFLNPHDFYLTFDEFLTTKKAQAGESGNENLTPKTLEILTELVASWEKWRFAETAHRPFRLLRARVTSADFDDELKEELLDLITGHVRTSLKGQTKEFKASVEAMAGIY